MKRFTIPATIWLAMLAMALCPATAGGHRAHRYSSSCGPVGTTRAIPRLEQLIRADRSLAGDGVQRMFDDDVLLFAVPVPGFAFGKAEALQHLKTALESPSASLGLTMVRAGISADCRHGFSLGYTDAAAGAEGKRLGKYVAYWVRHPQGWRVQLFKLLPRAPGGKFKSLPAAVPDFGKWSMEPEGLMLGTPCGPLIELSSSGPACPPLVRERGNCS